MSNFFKQGIAYILLISLLLESCSSPYMGMAKKAAMAQSTPTKSLAIDQIDDLSEPLYTDHSLKNLDNLALIQPMDPLVSEQGSLQVQNADLFKTKDSRQQNETDGNIPALIQPLDRVVSKRELLQASFPNIRQDKTATKQQTHQALSDKKTSFSRRNGIPAQNQLRASQQEVKHNRRANLTSQVLEEVTKTVAQLAPASQGINTVVTSKPESNKESQTFTAKGGHQVRFQQQASGQWLAVVQENLPAGISRRLLLPVYLEPGQSIATLGEHSAAWQKNNIHVVFHKQKSYVFVGVMGLLGGMMEDEGNEKSKDKSLPISSMTPSTQTSLIKDPLVGQKTASSKKGGHQKNRTYSMQRKLSFWEKKGTQSLPISSMTSHTQTSLIKDPLVGQKTVSSKEEGRQKNLTSSTQMTHKALEEKGTQPLRLSGMTASPQNALEEKGTQSLQLSGMTATLQNPLEEKGTQPLQLSGMTAASPQNLLKEKGTQPLRLSGMTSSPQNPLKEKGTQLLHLSGMTASLQNFLEEKGTKSLRLSGMTARTIENDATQRTLNLMEEKGTQSLRASGMTPRTQASLLKEIKCQKDTYTILYDLDRQEGRKIFEQTGLEIPFAPGQQEIEDYIIGKGSFGELRIGYATEKKRYVAIKITQGIEAAAETEIQKVLSGQPFIMSFLDAHESVNVAGEKLLCQVMPLAGLGNADQLSPLLQEVDPALREQLLFCIAKGFLQGIAKMHELSIIHLDLKTLNLVIDEKGHPLLIDFGCSQKANDGKIDAKKTGGTQVYLSPARWLRCKKEESPIVTAEEGKGYDAWAAGLTLYVLATNCPYPFSPEQVKSILQNSSPDKRKENIEVYFAQQLALIPELSNPGPDSYWALIKALLDPVKGFSVTQALAHPWFAKMEANSASWIQEAQSYLRELVQSVNREKRQEQAPLISPQQTSYATTNPLSPQDLPHAHFAAFVERTALQSSLQERLLKMSIQPLAMTVCQGMGGVGKSQLAIRMLHDEKVKDHFGLRLWFQGADRPEMLEVQHLFLAKELGLVDEKASPEKALKALHAYLACYAQKTGKPWLAIYDNADSPSLLKPYLAEGGHVLITTRNNEWPNAIPVDVFEPMEAEALTVKLLQREDPAAKTLCEELGYLALGIVQACAYIRHEGLSIFHYVEKLHQAPKILEQDERLFGKKLPSSMMALWQITFETLKKSCPDALALLHAVAYLAPDPIPQKVLSTLASPKAMEAALQYALLQKGETGSSMHRLTQQVLRLKDSEEKKVISLQQVLERVCEDYTYDPLDLRQRACNRQLLSHLQMLIAHSEAFKALPKTLESVLVSTYKWLADLQGDVAQYHLQKNLLEKGLALAKLAHGEESPEVALMLNNIGGAWKDLGEAQKAITYYEQALAIFKKTYGDQHPQVIIFLNNIGQAWKDLGEAQTAITYYEQALAIGIKTYGDQHPQVAIVLSNIGQAWNALGEAQKALTYYEQALAIHIKTYGDQHPNVAINLSNIGGAWNALGDAQKALTYYEKALTINIKTYGDQHPHVAINLNNIGSAWKDLGEAQKAITYYEQALVINIKTYGGQHPHVAICLNNIGQAWDALGDAQKAITYSEQALAIDIKIYGDQHPKVATYLNNIGQAWDALGDAQKALPYLEQAMAIDIKTYGDQNPTVAIRLNNIGLAWVALGDAQKALTYLKQALAIDIKTYGDQHPTVAIDLNNIGGAWKDLGEAQKALTYYEQALAIDIKTYGDQHPKVARRLSNIGVAWHALGEAQKAIPYFERALAIDIKTYGDQHPDVAIDLNNIGGAWKALGEAQKAITYYEQALAINIKTYGDQHPKVARRLSNIGVAWHALGEAQKAIPYFERALAIDIKTYGDQHAEVAIDLNNIGQVWDALDDAQKAITYYEQALAINIKTYGDQHPKVAIGLSNIGSAWYALGEAQKAIQYYEQACRIALVVWGKDHPSTLTMKNNLEAAQRSPSNTTKTIPPEENASKKEAPSIV